MGKKLFVGIVDFVSTAMTTQGSGNVMPSVAGVRGFLLKRDFVPMFAVAHGTEGPAFLVVVNTVF